MIVVLIGAHGAGKTTLGHALANATSWTFHDEIGRRLSLDPSLRPLNRTAEDVQEAFDEAVFRAEHERDLQWERAAGGSAVRIVETWHFGNLAYARLRSPAIARKWGKRLRRVLDRRRVIAVPVTATVDVLAARQSEHGGLAFFARVGADAIGCALELGAQVMPEVRTDAESAEVLATRLVPELRRIELDSARAAKPRARGAMR